MKSQLAIEISENAVRFARLLDTEVQSVDVFFFKDKTDVRYKEQLDDIVKEKGYRDEEFDDYSLSWCSSFSSLLPNNVYSEVNEEDAMHLAFKGEINNDSIDHNRIPELSIVNIFSIPLWVKSFFVIRFPRIVMQHEGSHLLHGLLSAGSFNLQVAIVLHEDNFNITISNKNELLFYSYFDYQNEEDVVYHLMYTLQQKELLNQKGVLFLCAGVGGDDLKILLLKKAIDKLKDLKLLKQKINSHLLLNFQSLCV
jgi:hypothetical protein